MKRIKPEDVTLTKDFTTVPPPKRFVPSPHFYQHPTNRMSSYNPYVNQGQNYMYGAPPVQIPPPPSPSTSQPSPQQWQFQKQHPPPSTPPLPQCTPPPPTPPSRHPLVFDPTQPPPSFPQTQEHRNSPGPTNKITIPQSPTTTNPLMLHHPIRLRGRGRGQYRGTGVIGSFDRGGRLRNPNSNTNNSLFNVNAQQKVSNGQQISQMIEVDCTDDNQTHINKKSKRKPMSTRYTRAKEWDREDANKALDLEKEYNRLQRTPMLILKFPDPDVNKYIVKRYSQFIETVHFQQPSTPRYCFVQLKENADIEKVRKELCEIPFGTGKIIAERKFQNAEEGQEVTPEEIDPYTLYIGNLPTQISVKTVKEHFPKATRIDIGYAQRMKYTRYAFIRYRNVDDAMEAYKKTFNTLIANRSLIVRFRRAKGNIGLPGESKTPNPRKPPTTSSSSAAAATTTSTSEIITTLQQNLPVDNQISNITTNESNNNLLNSNNLETEEIDTKVNVLRDAQILSTENSTILDNITETSDKAPNIKSESDNFLFPELPNTDGIFPVNNILGTRIKEEPFDDDALLAQAQCYEDDDMDDDESDCEPEEEDDFDDNITQNPRVPLIKPIEECQQSAENWEGFRHTELTREESKPDLDNLLPFVDNGHGSDYNKSHTKLPDPFSKKTDKENLLLSNNLHYNDGLDELFNSMNPEDENDEFDF